MGRYYARSHPIQWTGKNVGSVEYLPHIITLIFQYIVPWAHVGRCRKEMYDPVLGERVWNALLE